MKQAIRLTESKLRNMIQEVMNNVLNEMNYTKHNVVHAS